MWKIFKRGGKKVDSKEDKKKKKKGRRAKSESNLHELSPSEVQSSAPFSPAPFQQFAECVSQQNHFVHDPNSSKISLPPPPPPEPGMCSMIRAEVLSPPFHKNLYKRLLFSCCWKLLCVSI